ncbi:UspA domain-containing protein [Pseudoscourfieldia marina]
MPPRLRLRPVDQSSTGVSFDPREDAYAALATPFDIDVEAITMQRRILVCVDDTPASEHAIKWCMRNVAREGDVITLMHIVPLAETTPMPAVETDWPHYLSAEFDAKLHEQLLEDAIKANESTLMAYGQRVKDCGYSASRETSKWVSGHPQSRDLVHYPVEMVLLVEKTFGPIANAISKASQRLGASAVIIASSGKKWFGKLWSGSVSADLANRSPARAVIVLHGLEGTEDVVDPTPVPLGKIALANKSK